MDEIGGSIVRLLEDQETQRLVRRYIELDLDFLDEKKWPKKSEFSAANTFPEERIARNAIERKEAG